MCVCVCGKEKAKMLVQIKSQEIVNMREFEGGEKYNLCSVVRILAFAYSSVVQKQHKHGELKFLS